MVEQLDGVDGIPSVSPSAPLPPAPTPTPFLFRSNQTRIFAHESGEVFKTRTLAATGEVFYMNTARSAWEPFPDAWLAQGEFRDSVVFRTWTRAADNVEFITFQGMGVCVGVGVCVLWFRRGEVGGALWTSHEVFPSCGFYALSAALSACCC